MFTGINIKITRHIDLTKNPERMMISIYLARYKESNLPRCIFLRQTKLLFTIDDGCEITFLKNRIKVSTNGPVYLLRECLPATLVLWEVIYPASSTPILILNLPMAIFCQICKFKSLQFMRHQSYRALVSTAS